MTMPTTRTTAWKYWAPLEEKAWTALAAPLGVRSDDGRMLAVEHRWRLRDDKPVALLHHSSLLVGVVEGIHQTTTALYLTGRIHDPKVIADIAAGRLCPQLDLSADLHASEGDTLVFGGEVRSLTLGVTPCWPDQVWIKLGLVELPA